MRIRQLQVGSLAALILVIDVLLVAVGAFDRPHSATATLQVAGTPTDRVDTPPAVLSQASPIAAEVTPPQRPIAPAPEQFDGELPPGAAEACAGERLGPPASAGTWAVTVGINDYPGNGHDLAASVNDARAMDSALARLGVPADHRLLLVDGSASACGVRTALDWLVARAAPGSTAVFFYSGHARRTASSRVLVAADGALISDTELGDSLSRLPASRAWIALATCYGAGFTQVLAPGRILTGAAGADDLAYEAVGSERSFMGEYMIQRAILQGGAPGSVEAAFAYARSALQRVEPERMPVQIDNAPGELDLRPSSGVPLPPDTAGPPDDGGSGAPTPSPAAPPPTRPPVVPTTRACLLGLICAG
ncbi:MAG TPA: caspase family protein [Acidimicrobiales bacterium]|nr:caspase family protein [Acidimicrobiales bacterium]